MAQNNNWKFDSSESLWKGNLSIDIFFEEQFDSFVESDGNWIEQKNCTNSTIFVFNNL